MKNNLEGLFFTPGFVPEPQIRIAAENLKFSSRACKTHFMRNAFYA
ncbi:hypothetical protein GPL15_01935 [Clostridium sp. MCC353]|nr:hypothetical protein [Clostridium sp. MCC353]MBT9775268.1 hypothetical protein [Clostridium sp. MCC353]